MNELINSKKLPVPEYKLCEIGVIITRMEIESIPPDKRKAYTEYKLRCAGVPILLTEGTKLADIKLAYGSLHSESVPDEDYIYYTWRLKWVE